MEEFRNIFAIVLFKHESATRVWACELCNIEDQVVKDDKLLLALDKFKLKVFLIYRVERLIEMYRLLAQEPLMVGFKDDRYGEEEA